MPLILDGNNVLHAPMPPVIAGLTEGELVATLGRTPWAEQGVLVVFDGKPGPERAMTPPTRGVEVLYSGVGRTADEVIIERVREHSAPRQLVVVSSDHEIRKAARRRRASVWASDEFVHRLAEALRPPPAVADKPLDPTLSDDEVSRWVSEFGLDRPGSLPQPKRRPPVT